MIDVTKNIYVKWDIDQQFPPSLTSPCLQRDIRYLSHMNGELIRYYIADKTRNSKVSSSKLLNAELIANFINEQWVKRSVFPFIKTPSPDIGLINITHWKVLFMHLSNFYSCNG